MAKTLKQILAEITDDWCRRNGIPIQRNWAATINTLETYNNMRKAHIHLNVYRPIWEMANPRDKRTCFLSISMNVHFRNMPDGGISGAHTVGENLKFKFKGYWYTFKMNSKLMNAVAYQFDADHPWPAMWGGNFERIQLELINRTPVQSFGRLRKKRKDAGKPRDHTYASSTSRWTNKRVRGVSALDLSALRKHK